MPSRLTPAAKKPIMLIAILSLAAVTVGCGGGRPFDVKTRPEVPAVASGARAEANGIIIQAEAVTDEDFLYETFDANLILAGILPVRVNIKNEGQQPVELKKAKFEVRPASGRAFNVMDARRAFRQLISYYGISTYSDKGYDESLAAFSSHAIDMKTALAPGQSREGMIFFRMLTDDVRGVGLTLIVSRLAPKRAKNEQAIELILR
jgi:hypothetical protein